MPTTSRTRSQAVRQSLHLHIQPSSYMASETFAAARTPPSAAATIGSQSYDPYYRPPTGISEHTLFSVLCLYDFDSDEAVILRFKKNEILDVVKCDDTGWWAAMRKDGPVVGWIPQAYVAHLSNEMAEKLRGISEELRFFEYEAEQLYASANVPRTPFLFDTDSATTSPLPEYQDYNINTTSTSRPITRQTSLKQDQKLKPTSTSRASPRLRPQPPPSPNSPMPLPPGAGSERKSKKPHTSSDTDKTQMRRPSLSRNTSIRPRPVILEDTTTLSRLSTLIETNNKRDIKKLAVQDINDSLESMVIRGRDTQTPKRKGSANARHLVETIIDIKPAYLQLQYADQIDEDDKGHIRTATLPALIERLTTDMPYNLTKLAENRAFTNVFLMTFRTFTTGVQLFDMLVARYHMEPSKQLDSEEYRDWTEKLLIPSQRRILQVFGIWLEEHRLLEEETGIAQKLTHFLRTVDTPPHDEMASQIIKTIERLTFTVPRPSLSNMTPKKPRKSKPHRNDLLRLDPSDLAEQLALRQHTLYAKVTPQECLAYAKTQSGEAVAKLQDFCSTHDKLASWVKASILNHDILSKRSGTVDFWIKVAEKCRQINNFDSMSAIISALSSTVITRLHLTWAHVSRKSALDTLLRHNEPTGNFGGYRTLLLNAEGPCVPFIAMYLKDIILTSEQFTNQDNDGQICFYQRARWHEITLNILKFQSRMYNISPSEQTTKFIEEHLKEGMTRDQSWFWSKSQEVQHTEVANADIRKGLEEAGF